MENNINTLLHECDRLKERLTEIRPLPVEALKKKPLPLNTPTKVTA